MSPIAGGAPRVRSFIAIRLADPAQAAVAIYLERLRGTVAGVAWTRSENLHLTLKFLGDIETERVPALSARLRTVAAATAPFTLHVAGVGAFPNLAHPRALWVGVAAPELAALGDAVEQACRGAGFPPESRALRPHVTLGRVRDGRRGAKPDLGFLATDGERVHGSSPVGAIVLARSELRPEGACHSALATLPLGVA